MNTSGRRGSLTKTITVETSDSEHRMSRLTLKMNVIVEAELNPAYFNFGRLNRGEKVVKTAGLVARDPEKTKLTKVEWVGETPDAQAKIIKVDGRDAIQVEFTGKEIGLIRRQLKVYTNSEKAPQFEVMVRAQVLGNWEISTRTVSFAEPNSGEEAPDNSKKRSIRFTERDKTPYRITKAIDPEGNVKTTVQKVEGGYTIDLYLQKVPENRRGSVEITTNDPDEPQFSVRYYVRKLRSVPIPHRPIPHPIAPRMPVNLPPAEH